MHTYIHTQINACHHGVALSSPGIPNQSQHLLLFRCPARCIPPVKVLLYCLQFKDTSPVFLRNFHKNPLFLFYCEYHMETLQTIYLQRFPLLECKSFGQEASSLRLMVVCAHKYSLDAFSDPALQSPVVILGNGTPSYRTLAQRFSTVCSLLNSRI